MAGTRPRSLRALLVVGAGLPLVLVPFLVPASAQASITSYAVAADAYVSGASSARNSNFGTATSLQTGVTNNVRSYLRFSLPAGSTPVTSAVLRVYATTSSSVGYRVSRTGSTWQESAVTGSNAPAVGALVGGSGSVTAGTWTTVDVTSAVVADGAVNLVMTAPSGGTVGYLSKEAGTATAPRLVLTTTAPSPTPSPAGTPATGSGYRAGVQADGPAGYWRLGETTGTAAADSSGNGGTGTYSGGLTRATTGALSGDSDRATGFDGASGVVSVPDSAALRLNGAFTVEFWARLDAFKGSYPGLLLKGAANGPSGYLIWYTSNGQLNFKRNNVSIASAPGALVGTGWRHFAVTYESGTLRWYVAGALSTTVGVTYPTSTGTAPLQLGRGDEFGQQSLDEVALYNRALSPSQVAGHRAAGVSGTSPSPSASPSPSPTPAPTSTPAGPAAVIAAAGDVACDPTDANFNGGAGTATFCRQQATAALLDKGYAAILPLGDEQYTDATLDKLNQVYGPSWGRTKALHRPVVGNHEYLVPGAAGYFDYYGTQAGQRGKGWYSYDVGSWHVIALNGEEEYCANVSCRPGSEQETWLKADLAAHPTACTLAYWHWPRFSSSFLDDGPPFQTFWQDLYAAGVDVVLNGHIHNYERFAPQNPAGAADPKGIRQFVVGTGGKGLVGFGTTPAANSEVRNSSTYGVLEMTLRDGAYDWRFVPVVGQTFSDAGSTSCH